ncbi:MAG: serine/threonine-protein kinase PknK, partial [Nannocystaceae bacterium]
MSEGGERLRHLSRYEVIEPLGRGGMGEVYKARDLDRDRIVALKTLRKFDPRALLRFKAEFRSVARLKHANLVRLGELHIDDHAWAFSMEYVDGTDFVSWVQGSKYRDFEVEFGAPPLSGTSSQSSLDAPAASATPLCTERPAPTHKEMRRDAPDLPPLRELSDVEMSSSMELPSFTQDTQGKSLGISPTEAPPVSKPARELFGTISDTAVSDEDTSLAHGVPLLTPSDSDASDPSGAQVLPTTATVPQPATASSQVPTLSKPATADAPSPAASASVPTSVHMNRVRYALGQLALGVQTVHDAGLLHLDIKPGNVMVTGEGRVVLLDFGLVRSLEPLRVRERPRVVGTPAYMAPEQGMAKLPTTASDWYAVGSLLYKSLTGRHPFLGDRTAVLLAKQDQLPPAVSTLNPDVPEDLEALCMDLLAPRPEDRPTGPEILQRLHMPYEPVESGRTRELFGRSDELAAFTELVERLHRREPSIVHVRGLSGMGKSRLVQGFLENLGHPEFSVLEGRCFELETVPYNAFDRVIDSLVQLLQTEFGEIVDDLRTELQSVGRLFPVVRGLLPAPLSLPPPTDVQAARRHALNSLKTILYRLALDTPLVISIDDLQWSDSDSAALLTELFSAPHPVPMLLVVSYRADEVSECVALDTLRAIERRGLVSVQHIDVGPIDPDAAMTFARHVLGPNAPSHLPSDLVHEADGNPLFLEELCIHAQRGDLVTSPTLQEIIRERARDLDVADRTLLEVLAVAQQPLALEVALEAADVDAAESLEIIRSLEHQHLIRTRGPRLEDVAEV